MGELIGTYQCVICEINWNGSEIYRDPQSTGSQRLMCGDLACGANVRKISSLPKKEYQRSLE